MTNHSTTSVSMSIEGHNQNRSSLVSDIRQFTVQGSRVGPPALQGTEGPHAAPICLSTKGEEGLEKWACRDWPGRANQASLQLQPARKRMGQRGILPLASHKACHESGWLLPHSPQQGRSGERGANQV
eukprot:scaffold136838_cov33-Tisochrysis_lutea.AAC.4